MATPAELKDNTQKKNIISTGHLTEHWFKGLDKASLCEELQNILSHKKVDKLIFGLDYLYV